jgi:hypothetical protein
MVAHKRQEEDRMKYEQDLLNKCAEDVEREK